MGSAVLASRWDPGQQGAASARPSCPGHRSQRRHHRLQCKRPARRPSRSQPEPRRRNSEEQCQHDLHHRPRCERGTRLPPQWLRGTLVSTSCTWRSCWPMVRLPRAGVQGGADGDTNAGLDDWVVLVSVIADPGPTSPRAPLIPSSGHGLPEWLCASLDTPLRGPGRAPSPAPPPRLGVAGGVGLPLGLRAPALPCAPGAPAPERSCHRRPRSKEGPRPRPAPPFACCCPHRGSWRGRSRGPASAPRCGAR